MRRMICTMLHFVRSFSLNIWRIKRYVCFWPLWFSKPTISKTVVTFFSVRECFSLPVSCLWSMLHVSQIFPRFPCYSFSSKNSAIILRKLYFLNRYKFLIRGMPSLLNGTLHQRYIVSALKIIIYDNITCFRLQTSKCT